MHRFDAGKHIEFKIRCNRAIVKSIYLDLSKYKIYIGAENFECEYATFDPLNAILKTISANTECKEMRLVELKDGKYDPCIMAEFQDYKYAFQMYLNMRLPKKHIKWGLESFGVYENSTTIYYDSGVFTFFGREAMIY
jgi:hypothetical protein